MAIYINLSSRCWVRLRKLKGNQNKDKGTDLMLTFKEGISLYIINSSLSRSS